MQRQGALADPTLAGAHGHEMAHPGEPVGDAGPLLGNLLEDSGPSVAGDVVVALHFADVPGLCLTPPRTGAGGDGPDRRPPSKVGHGNLTGAAAKCYIQ